MPENEGEQVDVLEGGDNMTRPSLTRSEQAAIGRHVAAFRVSRIIRAIAAILTLAAVYWDSWHWLIWGGLFIWIIGKAIPPDPELDRITGR